MNVPSNTKYIVFVPSWITLFFFARTPNSDFHTGQEPISLQSTCMQPSLCTFFLLPHLPPLHFISFSIFTCVPSPHKQALCKKFNHGKKIESQIIGMLEVDGILIIIELTFPSFVVRNQGLLIFNYLAVIHYFT